MGAYKDHANAYLVKPFDFNDLNNMMRRFYQFWGESARLPEAP